MIQVTRKLVASQETCTTETLTILPSRKTHFTDFTYLFFLKNRNRNLKIRKKKVTFSVTFDLKTIMLWTAVPNGVYNSVIGTHHFGEVYYINQTRLPGAVPQPLFYLWL